MLKQLFTSQQSAIARRLGNRPLVMGAVLELTTWLHSASFRNWPQYSLSAGTTGIDLPIKTGRHRSLTRSGRPSRRSLISSFS